MSLNSSDVRSITIPFEGRIDIVSTPDIIVVNPYTRRVTIDPVLAAHTDEDDIAFWIVTARNLLLIRHVIGTLATTEQLRQWELAWCMYQAAHTYKLPTKSASILFSPTGTFIEGILSMDWTKAARSTLALSSLIDAAQTYHHWMSLGNRILTNERPATTGVSILQGCGEVVEDPLVTDDPNMVVIPKVDSYPVQWALDSVSSEDKVWPRLPSMSVIRGITNLQTTDFTHIDYRMGVMTKREVVREAFDIPTFYGKYEYSVDTHWVVYGDVSGSMQPYTTTFWSVVQSLKAEKLFVFSTEVHEASMDDTHVRTTGGTSYNEVGKHILENGYDNIVIISDEDSSLDKKYLTALKGKNIVYIKIGGLARKGGWLSLASQVIYIN